MRLRILLLAAVILGVAAAQAQQSAWASPDDKTANYIIDMERKWAEGVCVDNGVVAALLADDFQGTSTKGARFTKGTSTSTRQSALREKKLDSNQRT